MSPSKPYRGPLRKLVLAFDVGTTYSSVGYAILDPGEVPEIKVVSRFPGQENGDFKIPSVLYYADDGKVRAVGAEACEPLMRLAAEDEDLFFVEWFKLHLCPRSLSENGQDNGTQLRPLPPGKNVVDVFSDFLAYLFACAKRYIIESHPNGQSLWTSVENRIEIVLSHPNGWEGAQQSLMRDAAIKAGLIPDTQNGRQQVHFVSEGEASLHFCVDAGIATTAIKDGASVMIIDAGGGTVDLSTYRFLSSSSISMEEIAAAACILQGSTTVNVRAQKFLEAKLKNSQFGHEEDIRTMLEHFDKSTKPTFKCATERSFIKFGGIRDKDPAVGIRSGQLSIEGQDMAKLFEPAVKAIVEGVRKQRCEADHPVSLAFLVGGFAASPWLFSQLKALLPAIGFDLSRPESKTNKAVAEGAVSFYLEHFVSARIARLTYGVECNDTYDKYDPDHQNRSDRVCSLPSGIEVVPDAFSVILAKGTRVRDQEELHRPFCREVTMSQALNHITTEIMCYRGKKKHPHWVDVEPEYFTSLCTVVADTSGVAKTPISGPRGVFYRQSFNIVLLCGMTEMKAQVSWIENGKEKRGPAKIVYDDDVVAQ